MAGAQLSDAQRNHWSFQSIARPVVPEFSGAEAVNPIDRFIGKKLRDSGLSFAPEASREQLIRRVSLDLIGLTPTTDEIAEFMGDRSDGAYERLIDRLLASKHYGERWGRHWLDLARFAESDGFEHDAVRPHAWRYRDYVVTSFNTDKPYDRFIKEQLAGDELFPNNPEAVTATGFNLLGPDMVDSSEQVQRRHNTLNDMTDTAALTFLGLTLGCARCHDHKLEPLTREDYYRFQAFFSSAKFEREQPIPRSEELTAYNHAVKQLAAHPKSIELAALEKPLKARLFEAKLSKLSPEAQAAHRTPVELRTAQEANLILETTDKVAVSSKELGESFSKEQKAHWQTLQKEVQNLPQPRPLPKAMGLNSGSPVKTFVLNRGDHNQPLDEVSAGTPTVLSPGKPLKGHRSELADWIASRDNPLTARVMVNRIWQHHFGRGIVPTPGDFGTRGTPPTHPELLDWLASEFMDRGWSIKQIHKLILMSRTFRQSGEQPGKSLDPENRLFSRMNRLRLEGEVIRDCLLQISGELNPAMGGPGMFPPIPKELFAGAAGWNTTSKAEDYSRRSIYIFARRNLRFPFLEVFDAPDNNLSCAARERSTTAPQSLTLLNADEVLRAAQRLATEVRAGATSAEDQVIAAYRLVLCRKPAPRELVLAREFVAKYPLEEFCRGLFNLNEFVYVN